MFRLPDGGVGVVIGDVAGVGLRAAIVMTRLRSALRAYAIESSTPSEALTRLGRKFAHFEHEEMATVLYMTISPDLSRLTWSSSGHLPPVMAAPGRDTILLEGTHGEPIGFRLPRPPIDAIAELLPGSTVGCFTDGLVERRGESIDVGLERLRVAFGAGDPEQVCNLVMSELIGSSHVYDDTALLVFRRTLTTRTPSTEPPAGTPERERFHSFGSVCCLAIKGARGSPTSRRRSPMFSMFHRSGRSAGSSSSSHVIGVDTGAPGRGRRLNGATRVLLIAFCV